MVKHERKFKKYFVKESICQRCGFDWKRHSDREKNFCIAILKHELDAK